MVVCLFKKMLLRMNLISWLNLFILLIYSSKKSGVVSLCCIDWLKKVNFINFVVFYDWDLNVMK